MAASDKWVPKELFCTHCGSKRTHNPEKIEWVDDNDYQPEDKSHIRLGTSSYTRASEATYTNFQKDVCSCGHKVIDCDCKAGCKCGCNKRYLNAY